MRPEYTRPGMYVHGTAIVYIVKERNTMVLLSTKQELAQAEEGCVQTFLCGKKEKGREKREITRIV